MANKYVSPEEREFQRFYKISSWWITHRAGLKRIGVGTFVAIDVLLFLFVAWTMLDSFVISAGREHGAVSDLVTQNQAEHHARTVLNQAQDLLVGTTAVIPASDNQYEFYAPVSNPNPDWWAEFDYRFVSSVGETEYEHGFILPDTAQKPFASFRYEASALPRNAALEIENLSWNRVDHHLTGDYATFRDDRLDFVLSNIAYDPDFQLDDKRVGRVSFDVYNRSAFSYFDPTFYVVLLRGDVVVGVNRTILNSLEAGERTTATLNWFGTIPSASRVIVVPSVNIFDTSTYKALEGDSSLESRGGVPARR